MRAWQLKRFARSAGDVRPYLHLLRMVHHYNYAHVSQLRLMRVGRDLFADPTAIFSNGERIELGSDVHIGPHAVIYAGTRTGRVVVGDHSMVGPGAMITAANYDGNAGSPMHAQPMIDGDVIIGSDVWLGAHSVVLAGVTIGDGAIVGAGAVVIKDLPPGAIAMGNVARIVGWRDGFERPAPPARPDAAAS